jgi:parvulin-like peptidyl-prolyl isomerase
MNPSSEAGIFEYTLAHIVFNPKKGGPQAARQRAENALKKIREGAPFETVAEQTSEDPGFSNGGLLGTFKAGEFSHEIERAVQGLNAGGVSEIITTKGDFQIFKVLSKKRVTDPQFDKEKEKIRAQLFEKAFQKHFKNWLDTKREDSFVRINQ